MQIHQIEIRTNRRRQLTNAGSEIIALPHERPLRSADGRVERRVIPMGAVTHGQDSLLVFDCKGQLASALGRSGGVGANHEDENVGAKHHQVQGPRVVLAGHELPVCLGQDAFTLEGPCHLPGEGLIFACVRNEGRRLGEVARASSSLSSSSRLLAH